MSREAEAFVGRHDFASFAANRGKPGEDTVRTINSGRVTRAGKCVVLEFSGDGFLYKMVRLMVGALVRCGRGRAPEGEITRRLEAPVATLPTARLVAPASGLFLVRVRY
jgi:tRNA pseudouridine38-40 synthase